AFTARGGSVDRPTPLGQSAGYTAEMLALVFGLLLASPALDGARAQLRQGKLEQVLFALQPGDAVPPEEAAQASALLVDAARLAHARKDKLLALQLAQMGLRRDPHSGPALKLLGEWSLQASEFNLAITYGHQWVRAEPGSEEAARFLARAEELERNWKPIEIQRGHRRRDRS